MSPWQVGEVDEPALGELARQLARVVAARGMTVHLRGDLGAGKTTFARALLRAMGVGERVKSPTYSLVESYRAHGRDLHHLDLYRIADPGELEWLGLADLTGADSVLVVEWPERGADALARPDLQIDLAHAGAHRAFAVAALTGHGGELLEAWRRQSI